MTLAASLMSSARSGTGRDDWQTPGCILERVRRVGEIRLDPCTTADNPTGAMLWLYQPDHDGLAASWGGRGARGLVYVNPPHSQTRAWMAKCADEARRGVEIISLVAARTDTRAWHESVAPYASAVAFWRGRLRFVGAPSGAPFPSALVYYGWAASRFGEAFHDAAWVVDV